jgi:hypothetical protein
MARVTVDASVIGDAWFADISKELIRTKGIEFVYAMDPQTVAEHAKAKKLGSLYTLLSKMNKVIRLSAEAAAPHIEYLESIDAWQKEDACDDPHIFAIVHACGVRYVFTSEKRLATCRDCLNKVVSKKYCSFSLIRSMANYEQHKAALTK